MTSEKPVFPGYLQESSALIRRFYKTQESIYQQGESLGSVLVIQQGYVKLYRVSNEGRQVTLSILGSNAVLGGIENHQADAKEFLIS